MVGRIGSTLGQQNVNIASMHVGRKSKRGRAIVVLILDEDLTAEQLRENGKCGHPKETAEEPVEQRHQHEAQSEPAGPRSPGDPSPAESTFFTSRAGCLGEQRPIGRS